ncbi:MAG TPA: HAD family hydrolase [Spirochaetota bacterium]|nr:HAD family hydrolase [Spirochaetota bacterium]
MKPVTHIAFDLDGTLFDVSSIAVNAFESGISSFIHETGNGRISVPSHEEIVAVLGIPVDEIFRRLFPGLSAAGQARLNDRCTRAFVDLIMAGGGALFPGVRDTLRALHGNGKKLLMASNGRPEYIDAVLDSRDIAGLFTGPLVCLGECITDKAGIVAEHVKSAGAGSLLVMIGDRKSDLDAAASNGVPFIGCAFGHAGDGEIRGAKWTVRSFHEIPSAVESIERSRT